MMKSLKKSKIKNKFFIEHILYQKMEVNNVQANSSAIEII
jgi:hypothetical protein